MNNVASILILVFLAISFLNLVTINCFMEDNIDWMKHFAKTPLKNHVPLALAHVLVLN
jgi:hypothetical protein